MTTRLLFEGPDTLVFWKESGIPSVPLRTTIDGRTLLSIAAAYYPEIRCCHGTNEWEGGVIHRLDNLTKGLVLIARNQKAYDALMQQQKKDMIQKEYRATVTSGRSLDEGFEDYPYTNPFDGGCLITSYFRSFGPGGKSVRPVVSNKRYAEGRIYTTMVEKEEADVLYDILDTPVSPELLPAKDGKISQVTEDIVGPYELHDFFLYYMVRFGFAPKKIFRLAHITYKDIYTDEIIKKWLVVFIRRFFAQQFKRSCLPDGPKVGTVTFSPRSDWRMPSDASAAAWMEEAESIEV